TEKSGSRSSRPHMENLLLLGLDQPQHLFMVRRFITDRISAGQITGDLKRLAAATAEIPLFFRAGTTGLIHPVKAPEAGKEPRLFPDPTQALVADIRHEAFGQFLGALTR